MISAITGIAVVGGGFGMLFTRREGWWIWLSALRGAVWSLAVTAGLLVFALHYYDDDCSKRPDELACLAEWDRETKAMEAQFSR